MATPREQLVDPEVPMHYHITSSCVQGMWLLGRDKNTGRRLDHRKQWLVDRLNAITPAFSVDVETYAIMSNHFHLVVYYDPVANRAWSDEEVAERWFMAHPAQLPKDPTESERQLAIEELISDPHRLNECRNQLGSLSEYMKCLKQAIAARANREADARGHFWGERFYSGAILSENALLTTMVYVDLNPVRAKIVKRIQDYQHTGIAERLRAAAVTAESLEEYLKPCLSGIGRGVGGLRVSFAQYRAFLRERLAEETAEFPEIPLSRDFRPLTRQERWQVAKRVLGSRPRAIGERAVVLPWLAERGFSARIDLLPA